MNSPASTSRVKRHPGALPKLTTSIFAVLLSSAIPASAANFASREPAPILRLAVTDAIGGNGSDVPGLLLQIDPAPVPRSSTRQESADVPPVLENRWAAGASSASNAGMNRAVDRFVNPPENVNVYAVQTEDHLNGSFGGTHGPDKTLAGFEIVFH